MLTSHWKHTFDINQHAEMERELERVQTSSRVISLNMGFKETEMWKQRTQAAFSSSPQLLYLPLIFENQKLSICIYFEQLICCFNLFASKFCLKSDFYHLSLKWMQFGLISCLIMQMHSYMFKCDLIVQILCGHTHTQIQPSTVYSKTKLD